MRAPWMPFALLAVLASTCPETTAAGNGDEHWSFELGVMLGRHDNYFFRGDGPGSPAPSAGLLIVDFEGEASVDAGRGDLTFLFEAGGLITNDIDGADNGRGGAGIEYSRGGTRYSGTYYMNPNRIFSEDGQGTFFDLSGYEVEVRQKFGRGFWVGAAFESDDWEFDPSESDRDADSREISATLRVPLGGRAGVRATVLTEEKDARSPDHDWSGDGFALALELRPVERVQVFARYKRRERSYDHAPPTDSNFRRDDTIEDMLLNVRVLVGDRWGIRVQDSYRRGESTRADRNYDANQIAAGVFFVF